MNYTPIDFNNLSQCVEVVYQQPSIWFVLIPVLIGVLVSVVLFFDIYTTRRNIRDLTIDKFKVMEWLAWISLITYLCLAMILEYFFI